MLVLQCLFLTGCAAVPQLSGTGLSVVLQAEKEAEPDRQTKTSTDKLGPDQYEEFGKIYDIMPSSLGYLEIGIASWYGRKFHGRLTAMGEVYDMYAVTAAHKVLPLPTMARVTNLARFGTRGRDAGHTPHQSRRFDSRGTRRLELQ